MNQTILQLLDDTKELIEKEKRKKEELMLNGDFFNIFSILGIEEKEVYMCKLLAELLNPKGSHGQKGLFLKLFFDKFLSSINIDIGNIEVKTEELTNHLEEDKCRRRIDIRIKENRGFYIPIEVKINAYEQDSQCHDYLEQVKKYYENRNIELQPMLIFITKTGNFPSTIAESEKNKIVTISWEKICEWLQDCIKQIRKIPSVVKVIEQYEQAIEMFIYKPGDTVVDEIMNILKEDENYMDCAVTIKQSLECAQKELWNTLKNTIKSKYDISPYHDDDDRLAYFFNKIGENITECKVIDKWNNKSRIDILYAKYDDSNGKAYKGERCREKLCYLNELANKDKFNKAIREFLDF